ncbi:MAG: hypothetical protein KC635_14625 [Myxococcales bacterium]|nr:hypothetical protein [Myxococcales bacterium]
MSAVDVLAGIGWLDGNLIKHWKQGRLDHLEAAIQTNPARIGSALRLLSTWATAKGLDPVETEYVSQTPARAPLRFSASGDAERERLYRTHWISPKLSPAKRDRIVEKAERPPELVVIQPLDAWSCHRCGGSGDLLIMEDPGPSCLACAGLGELVFLPAGDARATRRAKAKSGVYAVVVRFSRARKRYERKGLVVEPDALRDATD